MATFRIFGSVPRLDADAIARVMPTSVEDKRRSIRTISDFIRGFGGGARSGQLTLNVGLAAATATLTISSTGPANGQTVEICGVIFTAATTPATANEFQRSDNPLVVAQNLVAKVNAVSAENRGKVNDSVVASSANGVVTLTAKTFGRIGNGLHVAAVGTFANTVIADFAGGSEGTTKVFTVL